MEVTLDHLAEACYRWRAADPDQHLPEGFYTEAEEKILDVLGEQVPNQEDLNPRQNALLDAVYLQAMLRHVKEEQQ